MCSLIIIVEKEANNPKKIKIKTLTEAQPTGKTQREFLKHNTKAACLCG